MHDLHAISLLFRMRADFVEARAYGSGHINDTYCASYNQAGCLVRYIHQRINHHVFKNPVQVMENVARVTHHILDTLLAAGNPEAHRRTLTCIPAQDGKPYAIDGDGNFWRTYLFIEGARGYDEIECDEQAYQAAKAFGAFQNLTANIKGERLHETIPNFHNTSKRLEALEAAIQADPAGRASTVQAEIAFAPRPRRGLLAHHRPDRIGRHPRASHPQRHQAEQRLARRIHVGRHLRDRLDTTMPGSALYDFGDLVRTATHDDTRG